MERLKQANLQLNINKCEFLKSHVCYLGHILSKDGISPDPKKIEAVKCFPQLSTVKTVRQFLGLAGYYRRFIKHFAHLYKPLTKLLEKDVEFHWDEKTEKAFTALKEALCNPPILQYPDFSKNLLLQRTLLVMLSEVSCLKERLEKISQSDIHLDYSVGQN